MGEGLAPLPAHLHAHAPQLWAGVGADLQPVNARDALHDGPSQAAARLACAQHAEEPLAQPGLLFWCQAGSAVFHGQLRRALGLGHLQSHLRAIGAVAQGVVQQIAQQHTGKGLG